MEVRFYMYTNKKLTSGIALALMAGILPTTVSACAADAQVVTEAQLEAEQEAAKAFSDLPAGHWAYDAVQTLAKDGIVVGYEDALFKGVRLPVTK